MKFVSPDEDAVVVSACIFLADERIFYALTFRARPVLEIRARARDTTVAKTSMAQKTCAFQKLFFSVFTKAPAMGLPTRIPMPPPMKHVPSREPTWCMSLVSDEMAAGGSETYVPEHNP